MPRHRLSHQVTAPEGGRRLDVVAADLLGEDYSRSQVQRYISQGLVTVDGDPARPALKLRPGQEVAVEVPDPQPVELTPVDLGLSVLYEDAHLLVIDKPAGLVVHPAPGTHGPTLVHGLLSHCGDMAAVGDKLRPGIVHRLDKDTSGCLVAAKDDRAHRGLVMAFAAGRVKKEYLALVWGHPPREGKAESGIGRHPVDRKRMSSKGRHTKPALTRWRVTRRFEAGFSLLRVQIATGRTHQIRVHLSEAGFPVAGDALYGGRKGRRLPLGPVGQALRAAGRQMLHAHRLAFSHPVTREAIDCRAPLPPDFRRVLRALEEDDRA